jgi:hypothetical protein
MAYIGRQLVRGQNRILDDISSSFNGSTTAFNLTVSSSSSPPASVNQLWIILGGVLQKPGTDFTVADAVITFTTAPASTLSFWGMIQGDTSDINSPADASVTPSKIANSGDFAFPADVRFKDADGSHYVGLQAPSTVSSNLVWSLPAADGSANQLLKTDGSGNLGWASDTQSNLLDEDNMSSNSATQPASQQSIKAYADTKAVLTGSTNNTITTVTGAHAIQGEANLTYDGTTLLSNADTAGLTLRDSSAYAANTGCQISFQGKDSNEATKAFGTIKGLSVSADNGQLRFQTRTGGTLYDRLTILADGKVGIGLTTGIQSQLHVQDVEGTTLTLGNTDAAASDGDYLSGIDFWIKDNNDSTGAATASIRTYADQNHTASAKGTALAFHTTDDDTTTLNERMRITHDGSVGIGTDNPRGAATYIGLELSGTTGGVITFSDDEVEKWNLYGQAGNFGVYDRVNGRYNLKCLDDGDVELPTGNLKFINGKGIDFSATGDGSGTANQELLDDYEEGTWTPGLSFGSGTTGLVLGTAQGRYTKIGREIIAEFVINVSDVGSSTGTCRITNLPYTSLNDSGTRINGEVIYYGNMSSLEGRPYLYNSYNLTTAVMYDNGSAASSSYVNNSNFNNNSNLRGLIWYKAA